MTTPPATPPATAAMGKDELLSDEFPTVDEDVEEDDDATFE